MTITIGTDPEAFVVGEDGTVGVVVGLVGGSKTAPLPVDGGAVQEDNVLAEFNIDPASSEQQFVDAINKVVEQLEGILSFSGLRALFKPSHNFEAEVLQAAGEQALAFGCDPDFNAYTGRENIKPNAESTLRTAGGHIHIGYDNPDPATDIQIVRACDILLGIPSVLLDEDNRRRTMYGAAGCYRHKPYGVEYRSLSNFWLTSDNLKRWVYRQAEASVHAVSRLDEWYDVVSPDEVQRIINTGDTKAASAAVLNLGIILPGV